MKLRASPLLSALFVSLAAACADSAATVDALVRIDAPVVAAKVVRCPTTPMFKVGVSASQYLPITQTVPAGAIVEFKTTAEHSAKSLENLFQIDFGRTDCVQFTKPGLYKFYCTAHSFIGSVTVQ